MNLKMRKILFENEAAHVPQKRLKNEKVLATPRAEYDFSKCISSKLVINE